MPSRISQLLGRRSAVIGIYTLLSLLITAPLAFRFTSHIPFGSGDIWQNYWNFWWWKHALFELGVHPYHTDKLLAPFGTDLVFYTHSPFNMLVAMPVNWYFGEAAAYNFCVFLALALSGYGAFLLGRELTGDVRAGFLSGLVFTFFPQHIEQLLEHLNLFSTQFLPWALYYLVRVLRHGGRRDAVGLGVTFALNALCSWHLGLMLGLSIVPLLVVYMLRPQRPRWESLALIAGAAVLAGAILWPAVSPLIEHILAGDQYYKKPLVTRGIDPTYLLTPHFSHPVFASFVYQDYVDRAYGAAGFVCFLGFIPVALAAYAVWRRVEGWKYWLGYSVAFLLLALGSPMWWDGEQVASALLPHDWLRSLPLFRTLNVANRFMILVSLGLGILVAKAWTSMRTQSDARFYLFAGLILFEYWWAPFPTQEVRVPAPYHQMAADPIMRIGAVLDIPFMQRSRAVENMVAQTVHERPIGGGYLTTYPPEVVQQFENEPALADLMVEPKLERPMDFRRLIQLGFDTIVLHKNRADSYRDKALADVPPGDIMAHKLASKQGGIPDETINEMRRQLDAHNGPAVFEDDQVAIYYLRPGTR